MRAMGVQKSRCCSGTSTQEFLILDSKPFYIMYGAFATFLKSSKSFFVYMLRRDCFLFRSNHSLILQKKLIHAVLPSVSHKNIINNAFQQVVILQRLLMLFPLGNSVLVNIKFASRWFQKWNITDDAVENNKIKRKRDK